MTMEMPPQWDEARLKCSILGRRYPLDGVRNEARAGDRQRGQFDGANVLIAEDVSCIAWLICEILTEGGYDIVGPAASTRIAAELIAKRRVDAALLDVGLTDGPSFSLAQSLAARGIPFAFTTGCGPDEIPVHLRDRPIIGKPMDLESLLNVTRELCRPASQRIRPP